MTYEYAHYFRDGSHEIRTGRYYRHIRPNGREIVVGGSSALNAAYGIAGTLWGGSIVSVTRIGSVKRGVTMFQVLFLTGGGDQFEIHLLPRDYEPDIRGGNDAKRD